MNQRIERTDGGTSWCIGMGTTTGNRRIRPAPLRTAARRALFPLAVTALMAVGAGQADGQRAPLPPRRSVPPATRPPQPPRAPAPRAPAPRAPAPPPLTAVPIGGLSTRPLSAGSRDKQSPRAVDGGGSFGANGVRPNGVRPNGMRPNGMRPNGMRPNGIGANGAGVLPAARGVGNGRYLNGFPAWYRVLDAPLTHPGIVVRQPDPARDYSTRWFPTADRPRWQIDTTVSPVQAWRDLVVQDILCDGVGTCIERSERLRAPWVASCRCYVFADALGRRWQVE